MSAAAWWYFNNRTSNTGGNISDSLHRVTPLGVKKVELPESRLLARNDKEFWMLYDVAGVDPSTLKVELDGSKATISYNTIKYDIPADFTVFEAELNPISVKFTDHSLSGQVLASADAELHNGQLLIKYKLASRTKPVNVTVK